MTVSMTELVTLGPPFVVDSVALARRADAPPPTLEQCGQALTHLCRVKDAVKYWRGDVLNLAGTLFAEEATQLLDPDLLDEKESAEEQRVAGKVDPVARAQSPSWEHSQAVAKLAHAQQLEWLDRARGEAWSARKLATELAVFAAKGAKTEMRFWLVVECGTQARRDKLAERLGGEGFTVKTQEAMRKVAKPKKAKKGPVTAQRKHKGAPKMNTRRRVPK